MHLSSRCAVNNLLLNVSKTKGWLWILGDGSRGTTTTTTSTESNVVYIHHLGKEGEAFTASDRWRNSESLGVPKRASSPYYSIGTAPLSTLEPGSEWVAWLSLLRDLYPPCRASRIIEHAYQPSSRLPSFYAQANTFCISITERQGQKKKRLSSGHQMTNSVLWPDVAHCLLQTFALVATCEIRMSFFAHMQISLMYVTDKLWILEKNVILFKKQ